MTQKQTKHGYTDYVWTSKKGEKKNSGTQNLLENTLKLERIIAFMQNNEKGKYVHAKYQSLPPQ